MRTLPGLPQPRIAKVDCGSCRKCCRGAQLIVLQEDERPSQYDCYEFDQGIYALKRKPDGDCIYLGANGCTIWGRHPAVCRAFDCVGFVLGMDRGDFDMIGPRIENAVVAEGRRRLKAGERKR